MIKSNLFTETVFLREELFFNSFPLRSTAVRGLLFCICLIFAYFCAILDKNAERMIL